MTAVDADALTGAIGRTLGWDARPPNQHQLRHADAVVGLIERMFSTWTGGPAPDVWAEELCVLNVDYATAAYLSLRREHRSAPSIAVFLAEYRAVTTARPVARAICDRCDGTGLVAAGGTHRHQPRCTDPTSCGCSASAPCPVCPVGDRMRQAFERFGWWQ